MFKDSGLLSLIPKTSNTDALGWLVALVRDQQAVGNSLLCMIC